jgi:hypothetical protein
MLQHVMFVYLANTAVLCYSLQNYIYNLVFNLHFMKVSTENDNNFGYEKIMVLVDNMPFNEQYI